MLYFLIMSLFAQSPELDLEADETIVVEDTRDIHVYVAPIRIHNLTYKQEIESVIDTDATFTYSSVQKLNAKIKNERGTWTNAGYSDRQILLYNKRTIDYAHEGCNYRLDGLKCSIKNNHHYLETVIYVDDHQLVIKSTMYDPNAQVVNSSVTTNDMIIRWIKQQEVTVIQNQTRQGTQTVTHKPKEELPLKWEIPHMLLDKDLAINMRGLWAGMKFN